MWYSFSDHILVLFYGEEIILAAQLMDMLWSLTLGARGFFVFLLIRSQVFETFLVMQSVDRNLTLKLMKIYVIATGFCLYIA